MVLRDALDHVWTFDAPPQRIISLVPSTTESLFDFGCADRLIARTDYCVHPNAVESIISVGGTKNPDLNRIHELQPDLILANQEENTRAAIEALLDDGLRVVVFFPRTVRESIDDLHTLALILAVPKADKVLREIGQALIDLPDGSSPDRVFVPIWNRPLMTFNADTFPSNLMRLCGAYNIFDDRDRHYPLSADQGLSKPIEAGDRDTRYPRVTLHEAAQRRPDWIWLPDEPYVFSDEEANELAVALNLPRERVRRIDGSLLFWHGTCLRRSLREIPMVTAHTN